MTKEEIEKARQEINEIFAAAFPDKDEIHKAFVRLIRKHHPDKGGSTEVCQLVNGLHDEWLARPQFAFTRNAQGKRTPFDWGSVSHEVFGQLMKVVQIDGLDVEICGTWIWVHGRTKESKEALKSAGFRWSGDKAAWYWHKGGAWRHYGRRFSMDEIRAIHGSRRVDGRPGSIGRDEQN